MVCITTQIHAYVPEVLSKRALDQKPTAAILNIVEMKLFRPSSSINNSAADSTSLVCLPTNKAFNGWLITRRNASNSFNSKLNTMLSSRNYQYRIFLIFHEALDSMIMILQQNCDFFCACIPDIKPYNFWRKALDKTFFSKIRIFRCNNKTFFCTIFPNSLVSRPAKAHISNM